MKPRYVLAFWWFGAMLLFASPASAEVLDKELSMAWIVGWTIAFVFAGIFLWRLHWVAGIFGAIGAVCFYGFLLSEIHDSSVAAALQSETGRTYAACVYAGLTAAVISQVVGYRSSCGKVPREGARDFPPSEPRTRHREDS